jgi:Radical SAM superfamily/Iron-sulfur cluster-binding domain
MTGRLGRWIVEPFLHVEPDRLYNPLTDRNLTVASPGYGEIRRLLDDAGSPEMPAGAMPWLVEQGWLVRAGDDLAARFHLKYVALEANTTCNQACYFCPVSLKTRASHAMSMEFYERIVAQLVAYRPTLEGVSMVQYNEPTVDTHFLDRVRVLRQHGLAPAVLTNGSGLTPRRVDAIMAMGGLRFLSVNLSTLDAERYARDRGGDHLKVVLQHLDYMRNRRLAPEMVIVVLGTGDETHRRDHREIAERFCGSCFEVRYYEVMNRAGNVPLGLRPPAPRQRLCGCEQTGSRPLQWLHITPHGTCVLCCQDYHEQYVVGDLREQTVEQVLTGPAMARLRRWAYGLAEAPADFICRHCVYARTR